MGKIIVIIMSSLAVYFTLATVAKASDYTESDIACLALNAYHEARGEPDQGVIEVMLVTLNRVKDKRYESTVCGVVFEPYQFSWVAKGHNPAPTDQAQWNRMRKLADLVATGFYDHRNRGFTHYYAPAKASPKWSNSSGVMVGNHKFFNNVS